MSLLPRLAKGIDSRFGSASFTRRTMTKLFPDHWSFLLGEMALYSFVILVLSGIFLTFFFRPSMTDVVYHGSYQRLDGIHMSEAYASILKISFDVRGGLLMRQIHHWAALIFISAIAVHACRIFFTGAFRRPRELNWIIGTTMFALAAAEGFLGYSLPDDLLSGTGVRIAEGIMLSIPIVGTYIVFFVFGGQYPGNAFIHRFYIAHVLLVPGLIAALLAAHLMAIWHQEHTQWPGEKQREDNVVGEPLFPVFMMKTQSLFFFTLGVTALLGAFVQINPVYLYGPYTPASVSAESQPDWYIGLLEGSLRLMPGVVSNVGSRTLVWNVFIPAVLLPALFFLVMYAYPVIEEFATGDRRHHHICDRPRNQPGRTAIGAAVITMGIELEFAGADDVLSQHLRIPLFDLIWFLRVGFFVFPAAAFFIARYWCLALQRRDERTLAAGIETGAITQLPDGSFAAVTRPVPEERRAVLSAHRPDHLVAPTPRHLVPLPTRRRLIAQVRAGLNHFYTRYQLETHSSGDGQGRIGEPTLTSTGDLEKHGED